MHLPLIQYSTHSFSLLKITIDNSLGVFSAKNKMNGKSWISILQNFPMLCAENVRSAGWFGALTARIFWKWIKVTKCYSYYRSVKKRPFCAFSEKMSPIELIDEILDSVECDEVSVEQAIVQLRLIGIWSLLSDFCFKNYFESSFFSHFSLLSAS